MRTAVYKNSLPEDAMMIRKCVFMEEQGFENEFDEIDSYAYHIVMYNDSDIPMGVCRVFYDEHEKSFVLGRLAVLKEYRKNHLGSALIGEATKYIKQLNGTSLILHAQLQAKDFYIRNGFLAYGEIGYDEGVPHIWMKKII